MNESKPDIIALCVQKALKNENLVDYKINRAGTSEKSDGFVGGITFVNVVGKSPNGEEKQYDLVIKDSQREFQDLAAEFPMENIFKREIFMYDKVFPTFAELQSEHGIKNQFNSIPKCYATVLFDDYQVIVMENLRKLGYKLNDHKVPLSLNHIRLVFQEYGKYHALSFALKEQKPEVFESLTGNLFDVLHGVLETKNVMDRFLKAYRGNVQVLEDNNELELLKTYRKMEEQTDFILKKLDYSADPHAILIHGDCWNNNFLFKYNKNHDPEKVAILDWQISKLASPVFDLSYFFYGAAHDGNLNCLNELLDVYYGSLSSFLTQLGCDATKLFPRGVLQEHWKKYSKCGLIFASIFYRMLFMDKDDMPQLGEETTEEYEAKLNRNPLLVAKVVELIRHFVENDFI